MKVLSYLAALLWLIALLSLLTVVKVEDLMKALADPEVLYALALSLSTSFVSTMLVMVAAFPIAYELSRGSSILEPLLSLPNAMPPVAVGATLLLFFSKTPIGAALNSVIHAVFSVPGIIIAQSTVSFPLALKPLKSAFKEIDEDIILALKSHGCYGLCLLKKLFRGVERQFKSASLLVYSRSLAEFGASVTLAGAIRFKTETLPIAIYLNLESGDVAKVISLIALSAILAFVVLTISVGWELDKG